MPMQVTALASGLVEAIGEECDCSLSTAFNLDEMAYVTAVSASGAFAEVCVSMPPHPPPLVHL